MIRDKNLPISDIANTRPSDEVRYKQHTNIIGKVSNISQDQYHSGLKLNKPYTVGHKTSFNVKIKRNKETCHICGMCQLPSGSFIVTDYNNKRLEQLNNTYTVTNHCLLSDRPCGVCNTEEGEVAVALRPNTIQFVSVGDKLAVTRSFSTRHGCWSLAYHNKCIYVLAYFDSKMFVYKSSGSLLQTISTDLHGTRLFSATSHITVSPVLGRVYVTDRDKGLVTLDLQGNHLATFKPPELSRGAEAVCVDEAGNVVLGDSITGNILQVRQEGDMKVAQILTQSEDISIVLCFDNVNTRLLVSSPVSNTVTVLQLVH